MTINLISPYRSIRLVKERRCCLFDFIRTKGKSTKKLVIKNDKIDTYFQTLSFVFQDFNLISSMTIKENIELPLMMRHKELNKSKEELNEIVKDLQIENT